MAQVQITHFLRAIEENLYQGYEHLNYAISHDTNSDVKTIEIPLSGSLPDIEKDRSSYPIPVVARTDNKKSYDLVEYSLGAIRLSESDKRTLSYDKARSIIREHTEALNERIGLDGLYNWSPASGATRVFDTTGGEVARNPDGSDNTMKAISIADLSKMAAVLTRDNAWRNGKMYAVMPSDMYWSMLNDNTTELFNSQYMKTANLPTGIISEIMGFKIIVLPNGMRYDASNQIKAVGSTVEATDVWGALFYCSDFVCRAKGMIKVFADMDDPTYQADIYSAYMRFNATTLRNNNVGTVGLIQTA